MGGSQQFFDDHGDTIVVAHFNKGMVTVLPQGETKPLFGGPITRAEWEKKTDRFWPVNSDDSPEEKTQRE